MFVASGRLCPAARSSAEGMLQKLCVLKQYGLILTPAGCFGLIPHGLQTADRLRRLYEKLLPGGKLVLEVGTQRAQMKTLDTVVRG